MIKEIGDQLKDHNEDEWFTEQLNPDYCQVFQNFIRNNAIGSVDTEIEEGGLLISEGKYSEAIKYYEELIKKYPLHKAIYTEQIGAAYFFKHEYHKAKECYIQVVDSGSKTIDFNLWEVCNLLSKKENTNKYLKEYIHHFPNGEHINSIKSIKEN
jgi:tetratricopeptide (TPR) repeat protein